MAPQIYVFNGTVRIGREQPCPVKITATQLTDDWEVRVDASPRLSPFTFTSGVLELEALTKACTRRLIFTARRLVDISGNWQQKSAA